MLYSDWIQLKLNSNFALLGYIRLQFGTIESTLFINNFNIVLLYTNHIQNVKSVYNIYMLSSV